jgi:hypothetical protein
MMLQVVDSTLDIMKAPRKPQYTMAPQFSLILLFCLFDGACTLMLTSLHLHLHYWFTSAQLLQVSVSYPKYGLITYCKDFIWYRRLLIPSWILGRLLANLLWPYSFYWFYYFAYFIVSFMCSEGMYINIFPLDNTSV